MSDLCCLAKGGKLWLTFQFLVIYKCVQLLCSVSVLVLQLPER